MAIYYASGDLMRILLVEDETKVSSFCRARVDGRAIRGRRGSRTVSPDSNSQLRITMTS